MLRLATLFLTAMTVAAVTLGVGVGSVLAGGGGHGCMRAPSESEATTVTIRESCFVTTLLRVQPGTTVTFANRDSMPHNVFTSDNVALVRETELQAGADAHVFIERAGVLMYYCSLHPSMVGVIVAGDDTAAPALVSRETSAMGLPLKVDPASAEVEAGDDASGMPVGAVAGIAIAVGLVSAGGGFAIRRRG